MMDNETEAGARTTSGVLQHLQITVGIAKSHDRPPSNILRDPYGFARTVVNEIDRPQTHDERLAVAQFKLRLDGAADNLLRRHPIGSFGKNADKLGASA